MPRTKAQFAEMRRLTNEKVLSAAIAVFSRKGFAAAAVHEIATAAGISTGLMYRHYASKEELFQALVNQAALGMLEVAQLFQRDLPPRQLIEAFAQEFLTDLANGDEFAQLLALMTQVFMMEDAAPKVEQLTAANQVLLEATTRLIQKGQWLGQFKAGDPEVMAAYYFATIQGLGILKFTMKERFVVPTLDIVNAFLIKEQDGHGS